ncbi:6255_t:CDS:1, partial [Funneliformis geosporum]
EVVGSVKSIDIAEKLIEYQVKKDLDNQISLMIFRVNSGQNPGQENI